MGAPPADELLRIIAGAREIGAPDVSPAPAAGTTMG